MFRFLWMLSMVVMPCISMAEPLDQCAVEYKNLMTCSVDSGCSCLNDELGIIAKYTTMGVCAASEKNNDFCGVSMCCGACWQSVGAYQGCLYLQQGCDTSCQKFLPPNGSSGGPVAAPSPVMVFPPNGSGDNESNEDDDVGISSECIRQQSAMETCITMNYVSCTLSMESCLSKEPLEEATICQSMRRICHDATCCAACAAINTEFIECEFGARGCSGNCSNLPDVKKPKNNNHHPMNMMNMMKMHQNKSDKKKMMMVNKSQPKMSKSGNPNMNKAGGDSMMKSIPKMNMPKGAKDAGAV